MNHLKLDDTKFVFCMVATVAVVLHLLCTEEVPGLNLDRRQALVYKLFSFCSVVPIKYRKWMAYIRNDTAVSFPFLSNYGFIVILSFVSVLIDLPIYVYFEIKGKLITDFNYSLSSYSINTSTNILRDIYDCTSCYSGG